MKLENLKAIIVEDEKTSRDILKNYLAKYYPQVEVLGEAENIDQALVLIRNHALDLVFLDVEMPYGNAFDLLDKLGEVEFETVFVTAYNQYAMDAVNQHAAYYLMKPISIDELIKAVDYVGLIKSREKELQNQVLVPKLPQNTGKISIPTLNGFEIVDTNQILYCQADDNYTHLHLKNGSSKLVSKTLRFLEEKLDGNGFLRAHKTYLINLNAIKSYHKGKGGYVEMENGKAIPVTGAKKAELLNYFK
jgi:two-component system LytT family response regulator